MKEMSKNFIPDSCSTPYPMSKNMQPAVDNNALPDGLALAQAYVPMQPYTAPMSQEQSLICGTVFSDLLDPYCSGWHIQQFAKEE